MMGELMQRIGLKDAPFHNEQDGFTFPALVYTEDGGVHPCKV
jgi:hypothetical protein